MLLIGNCYADTGLFFEISESETTSPLNIKLALDGRGPLSIQNYTINGLNLIINTTIPNHFYPFAGIKIDNPGYWVAGLSPLKNGYYLFPVGDSSPANILIIPPNPPWYPSLEAFEHYNSGRSHVFPEATFGGSYSGNNTVDILSSPMVYPSGYNMAYLDPDNIFIYGGGYGDVAGSVGAFVAKVNPTTLGPIWYNQLINTSINGEWDYPGSMGILQDGFIYVSYGYRLAKLNKNGEVIDTLILPTGVQNHKTLHLMDSTPLPMGLS